jgi:hypothetical protein
MGGKDAIKFLLTSTRWMTERYLSDLSDADLLVRPTAGANHIAWQLGHVIVAEANMFLPKLPGAKAVELPAGFAEQHGGQTASLEPPTGFLTKEQYLELLKSTRQAVLDALDALDDAALDADSGMGWDMVPTVGSNFIFIAEHEMMHASQFSVVRRALGKPVLF